MGKRIIQMIWPRFVYNKLEYKINALFDMHIIIFTRNLKKKKI